MPVYVLRPIDPINADWTLASTYSGFCMIHAPGEEQARVYAAYFFAKRTTVRNSVGDSIPIPPPWLNPDLAECTVAGDPPPEEYLEGQIEITEDVGPSANEPITIDKYKDRLGRNWRVVKEGKPGQVVSVGIAEEQDTALPVTAEKVVNVGLAVEKDEAGPVTARTASSMLPPLQQHAEGPSVNEEGRGEQTLPRIQSNAGQRGGVTADAILVEPGPGQPTVTSEPPEVTLEINSSTVLMGLMTARSIGGITRFGMLLVSPQRSMRMNSCCSCENCATKFAGSERI